MNLKKLHPILHTIARYFLATVILMYAIAKIMGTQFSSAPSIWDKSIGELSGFELTWFFYGYSFWYGIFIASSQIIAAFLLFFKKTTRLGIVLYLSIIINILVLDFAYSIDAAKGMAIALTLVASYVFLSEFKVFFDFFITKPPLFENADRPNWINKLSKFKYLYIVISIVGLFTVTYTLKNKILTHNEFYGAWKPKNYEKWNRIYFEPASTFSIRKGNNFEKVYSGKYKVDRDNHEIEFLAFNKDYLQEEINVLNPDTTRMKSILKTKYQFISGGLKISNDTLNVQLTKLK
jgi:hypothetical protein